ncbi:hypothetical protein QUA03_28370 [Microcoleus sp. S36b_A4]|uniref:hypothetical protein n=1 Tax=Microcoleus sp. S36b_A4 TaxID=3055420 RepID=UPI002FCF1D21
MAQSSPPLGFRLVVTPQQLSWFSDSQQIAFIYNETEGDKNNLYVINRDGSGLTKLTNDKDLNPGTPVWQPQ